MNLLLNKGTNLKRLAGFRACLCLDNFYRLDRFGACKECSLGYQCTNETINLHPGFYWIWSQESEKENYLTFAEKLQTENKDHDLDWRAFNGTLPSAYVCPFPSSCKASEKKKIPSYLVLDIKAEWDVHSSIVDCKLTVSCTTFQDFEVTEITLILHHDTAIA